MTLASSNRCESVCAPTALRPGSDDPGSTCQGRSLPYVSRQIGCCLRAGGDGGLPGDDDGRGRRTGRHLCHRDRQHRRDHDRPHAAYEGPSHRLQHRPFRLRDPDRRAAQLSLGGGQAGSTQTCPTGSRTRRTISTRCTKLPSSRFCSSHSSAKPKDHDQCGPEEARFSTSPSSSSGEERPDRQSRKRRSAPIG